MINDKASIQQYTDTEAPPTKEPSKSIDLAQRVKTLRARAKMTLKDLSLRSGVSTSALSKLENGQLSPTYESILRLARGLDVDITVLFAAEDATTVTGRRTISRKGTGVKYDTANYTYEMLCGDLARKRMVPLLAHLKAKEIRSFGSMASHEGEEVIYVLRGKVVLHTEYYEPTLLEEGDCAYFDSMMGHACIAHGVEDATIFWVCSSDQVEAIVRRSEIGGATNRKPRAHAKSGTKIVRSPGPRTRRK